MTFLLALRPVTQEEHIPGTANLAKNLSLGSLQALTYFYHSAIYK